MASNLPSYQELYTHIVSKATKDDAFRQKLIAQPRDTVAKEIAAAFPSVGSIPAGIAINVVEQKSDAITIVLPARQAEETDELSDTELEVVAGGYPSPTCGGDTCVIASLGDIC